MKRWMAFLLAAVMAVGMIPGGALAAADDGIQGITLDKTEAQVPVGKTLTLQAEVLPEGMEAKQLVWTSSDPAVARLTGDGVVEALEEGETVITVQAGSHRASCEVTVVSRFRGQKTITVTTGAAARLYEKENYYVYKECAPVYVSDNGDGTTTCYFSSLASDLSWRVSMEGKITKAGYWDNQVPDITVLYSDDDPAPDARVNYASSGQANSSVAEDGVLLNVNGQNCLAMSVGESRTLKAYRAWELVQSFQNHVIMPDFHYSVLSGRDVVKLEEKKSTSNGDGDWMTLTALREGTAVIEVTYDAISLSGGIYDGVYGASDPARTGLLVVQVGGHANVDFGIESFASLSSPEADHVPYNPSNRQAWDAEFDTLYFTGSSGELKFRPSGGNITEVAVSGDKGASWTTLRETDGVYTADIVSGNNILRVRTASGTAYQVVRGDRVEVRYAELSGDGDGIIEAGEKVRVYLDGLHTPIPKISGNYNPGYEANEDGFSGVHLNYSCDDALVHGPGKQYDFITAANFVDVVMPDDGSTSLTLTDGYIGVGVLGWADFLHSENGHRYIPDEGCGMLYGYSSFHTRSILPEITIAINGVAAPNQAPVVKGGAVTKGTITQGQNYAINPESLFTDPDGDVLRYSVSVNGGAAAEVSASYRYTPSAAGTYKLTFTASDGEASVSHTITLTVEAKAPDQEKTEFGLKESEIAGYVYIGFEDKGVRVAGETGLKFPVALGTIISQTRVPFKAGENIAQVTLRLLDARGIGYTYSGSLTGNFYLASIKNFVVNNTPYDEMGEFDAGTGSGWMITLNGWFIDKSTAAFKVSNNDVIQWQYTCQVGKDIGDTYMDGGETDAEKVAAVEKLIKNLPDTITKSDKAAVEAAEKAYKELTEAQKAAVEASLRKKLEEARKTLDAAQNSSGNSTSSTGSSGGTNITPSGSGSGTGETAETEPGEEDPYLVTGDYLANLGTPGVNSIGGEWMVLGLARSGRSVPEGYYDNVLSYVAENINEKEQLHRAKSTENARLILALTAIGKDVTSVGGHNLLMGLTDMDYLRKQGINGPIWALIAFDCGSYPIPEGNVTREKLLETILEAQLSDGGWALTGQTGDPDMTGMALQALAPYYEDNARVKAAVDRALLKVSQMQEDDGAYASIDGPSAESVAQIIVALAALDIDPEQDARFVKNGNSVWDALLTYYVPGGGFRHVPGGELDGMATEQAYYAMTAYYRMQEGKTFLYDMTDVVDRGGKQEAEETVEETTLPTEGEEESRKEGRWLGMAALLACVAAAGILGFLIWQKKRSGKKA